MYIYNDKYLKSIYEERNGIIASEFYGDVLYLGLGSAFMYRQHTSKVKSTTFIENNEEIIKTYGKGLNIIQGDAHNIEITNEFDFIIVDIWDKGVSKQEVETLVNKWYKNLKVKGSILYLKTIKL